MWLYPVGGKCRGSVVVVRDKTGPEALCLLGCEAGVGDGHTPVHFLRGCEVVVVDHHDKIERHNRQHPRHPRHC